MKPDKDCPACGGSGIISEKRMVDLYGKEVNYSRPCNCVRSQAIAKYLRPLVQRCRYHVSKKAFMKTLKAAEKEVRKLKPRAKDNFYFVTKLESAGYMLCLAVMKDMIDSGELSDLPEYSVVTDIEVRSRWFKELDEDVTEQLKKSQIIIIDVGNQPDKNAATPKAMAETMVSWISQGKRIWLFCHDVNSVTEAITEQPVMDRYLENPNLFKKIDLTKKKGDE
jgi:hypothetical protein